MCILTQNNESTPQHWREILKETITNPEKLLQELQLPIEKFAQDIVARRLFPLRVSRSFVTKMEKGNPKDPLFLQVWTSSDELLFAEGFTKDPLDEQNQPIPNILHKYANRLILMVKNGCAINCRYCFRRHFPYVENPGNKSHWKKALDYIASQSQIEEVIFSGGDPLMATDEELTWLIKQLETIPHLKRLRIHSRLPVVIPERITNELYQLFEQSSLQIVFVTHINHGNEIDEVFCKAMEKLKKAKVTLLNQSVLLKGVNDNAQTLKILSEQLFTAGILPYYLHLLDKVEGASHFFLNDDRALDIYQELQAISSGFLVPKLAREIAGEANKTLYVP